LPAEVVKESMMHEFDVGRIVDDLDAVFREAGNSEDAGYMKSYLKSDLEFHGVKTAGIRKQTSAFARAHRDLTRDQAIALARACWERPVYEVKSFAVGMLTRFVNRLEPRDLSVVEELVRNSHTWAFVDSLATKVGADLVERHPDPGVVLDRWAEDENFWIRRTAMLVLLPSLSHDRGDLDRFLGYADAMLDETEFFIRKAIGWVLREVSKSDPTSVYDFVRPRTDRISGVTIREAAKYLPNEQKDELMTAYRERLGRTR